MSPPAPLLPPPQSAILSPQEQGPFSYFVLFGCRHILPKVIIVGKMLIVIQSILLYSFVEFHILANAQNSVKNETFEK